MMTSQRRIATCRSSLLRYHRTKSLRWLLLYILVIVPLGYYLVQPAPLLASGAGQVQEPSLVTQEFRYRLPEASEVYLVWGVNGWQVVPEEIQPQDTEVTTVMHTPMKLEGDTFIVKVQVPAGTPVDYGFQTRKKRTGTPIEWVWDGDYRLIAAKDSIIEKQGTVTLTKAKEVPLEFNIGPHLLIGVSLVFGVFLSLKRILQRTNRSSLLHPTEMISGTATGLYFFLLLIRANILGFNWVSFRYSVPFAPYILAGGYYDLIYVLVITLLFLGLLLLFKKNLKVQRLLSLIYTGVALFSLLAAFVNTQVIRLLGIPFNYQWFYYSDFLKSEEAKNAISANISSTLLLNIVTLSAAMLVASSLLVWSIRLLRDYSNRSVLITTTLFLFIYFPVAGRYISTTNWDYAKLANPITSFIESVIESQSHPVLFSMEVTEDLKEFQAVRDRPKDISINYNQVNAEIRNVIIFVMESVAAEYIEAYGGPYPVTPELNNYRQHSLLLTNIYAHAPASNKSLVSILGSIYPWISYQGLTQEYPDIDLPTLSSELKKYGYRSAFLSAGDIGFQRGNEFLAHRQFEKVADYSSLGCERQKFDLEWTNADGVDEECLVDAFNTWQMESPEQPFFTMMWTVGNHYPYFVVGEEIDYGVNDKTFNRYLNALHHSDQVLGKLIRTLEHRGLSESTLVIVVGDHGEAFGRHDQFGHASRIYEENLHVPLILINPILFKGEEDSTLGGLVDIAPTIMYILDLPTPEGWQGQSLFNSDRSGRVYFFSPWWNFLFGYREGHLKFIFNASTGKYELYDLRVDPIETTNLADQRPDIVKIGHRRLAAWVQYHNKFIEELLKKQN